MGRYLSIIHRFPHLYFFGICGESLSFCGRCSSIHTSNSRWSSNWSLMTLTVAREATSVTLRTIGSEARWAILSSIFLSLSSTLYLFSCFPFIIYDQFLFSQPLMAWRVTSSRFLHHKLGVKCPSIMNVSVLLCWSIAGALYCSKLRLEYFRITLRWSLVSRRLHHLWQVPMLTFSQHLLQQQSSFRP